MSILWLIPSAILAFAAVALSRGTARVTREVRDLRKAVTDADATLEALRVAVAEARTSLGSLAVDGARPGSPSGT